MADARPGVHALKLRSVSIPDAMTSGTKFIKWTEESQVGVPVTAWVDDNGYMLFWRDQLGQMDFLDVASIRDTRTGKQARLPRDSKLRDLCSMGPPGVSIEQTTVTVAFGSDMVNIQLANFVCAQPQVAKVWADTLLAVSKNLLALNGSVVAFLEKTWTRLRYVVPSHGNVLVKNITKLLAQSRDDRKRVQKALDATGWPSGKNDVIRPEKFTFLRFLTFYRHLTARSEVEKIFTELGANKKNVITVEQFVKFINNEQRDPRLNEILYPYCNVTRAKELIERFEPGRDNIRDGHLSVDGFLAYLMSDENGIIPAEKLDLHQDMDQPLTSYFVNSSHNTYLTGHQLTGRSSVEIYRQALLSGCRCVELDCWDGKGADEEPVVTHGFTMCTEVVLKDVLEAVAECAFKLSSYPVILSLENHCSPKQQAKIASHLRTIFGELLLTEPLTSHPLQPGVSLPSPEQLRGKVIIKNKKKKRKDAKDKVHKKRPSVGTEELLRRTSLAVARTDSIKRHSFSNESGLGNSLTVDGNGSPVTTSGGTVNAGVTAALPHLIHMGTVSSSTEDAANEEDDQEDSESDEDDAEFAVGDTSVQMTGLDIAGGGTSGVGAGSAPGLLKVNSARRRSRREAHAGEEMSALVNYIQPVHFHSFEHAEKRNHSYEVCSFVETQATSYLKEQPVEFVNHNKRQLTRVYPKGTRVDSSNFMPQIFWDAGCQLVALNYQTLDLPMQLNLGTFEYNGCCGFLLKPDFMRRNDRTFDPFAESTVDGIVAGTVSIRVLSGQFLTDKRVGTFVECDMYGLPADTVRKRFRTRTVPGNGINPVYTDDAFVFKKVVLPELAVIRIAVMEETGKLIGHRVLPVSYLRPGYRHLTLRNEANQPLNLSTLFLRIGVRDYVPDLHADFAAALTNPIAYQSKVEKHAQQLACLVDEDSEMSEESLQLAGSRVSGSPQANSSAPSRQLDDSPSDRSSRLTSRTHRAPLAQQSSLSTASGGGVQRNSSTDPDSPVNTPSRDSVLNSGNKHSPSPASAASTGVAGARTAARPNSIKGDSQLTPVSGAVVPFSSTPLVPGTAPSPGLYSVTSPAGSIPPPSPGNPTCCINGSIKLSDPNYTKALTLEFLREQKAYQKLLARQVKEVEAAQRKITKKEDGLNKAHAGEQTKLSVRHKKESRKGGKLSRVTQRKSAGTSDTSSESDPAMTVEAVQKARVDTLRRQHSEKVCTVLGELKQTLLGELGETHVQASRDMLADLLDVQYGILTRKLEEAHKREVKALKKEMDERNGAEMKQLAAKHKNKEELQRRKREVEQKFIKQAVAERGRLQDLFQARQTELSQRREEVLTNIEHEKDSSLRRHRIQMHTELNTLRSRYSAECSPPHTPGHNASPPPNGGTAQPTATRNALTHL